MPGHFGTTAADDGLQSNTNSSAKSGVFGSNDSTAAATAPGGSGVFGLTVAPGGVGVFGANNSPASGRGVQGNGPEAGVGGFSNQGTGVLAQSNHGDGLLASTQDSKKSGVFGKNDSTAAATAPGGSGVFGLTVAPGGVGVFGANNSPASGRGVQGNGPEAGVGGFSDRGTGVLAQSKTGIGITAQGGHLAAKFVGDVEVSGDIRLVNADCAEDFDIAGAALVDPGTVMVLGSHGALFPCLDAYDKRVAGVISGAGDFKPGIVLDKKESNSTRLPVALLGKVFCKVDAAFGAVEVGDLLTTSPTPGHAMKAAHQRRAFGAVIGKALRPLPSGRGLIPILIALQ
ncbi:MAG: hypothetical protein ACXWKP_26720 [Bradyrhizobium sp.]